MKTRPSRSLAPAALAVGVIVGLLGPAPRAHAAPGPKVAVAKVTGRKSTAPGRFEKGLKAGLKASGVDVLSVGKVNPSKEGFMASAEEAGADYLVVVRLRYSKRKRFATAQLFDLASGEQMDKLRRSFRSKRKAGKAGAALGQALGKAVLAAFAEEPEPEPEPEPPVLVAPEPKPSPKPEPEAPAASAKADEGPGLRLGGKEDAVFMLSVGAGTQLGSAYTVAVDGEVTGLAYTLGALFLTQVDVSVQHPTLGIGGELWLSFVPVSYQVDVSPPVEPREPGGRFFNVGGAVKYRLRLTDIGETGGLFLTPLLGVGYDSMSVEEQGANTVVVSYSTVKVQGGLRFGVGISEDLIVNLETRVGGAVAYSESPTSTGEGGSGFNLGIGGGARYWINDIFGVHAGLNYSYQQVGLSGLGTRVAFEGDPQLLDATVYNGDFKITTGVQIAL